MISFQDDMGQSFSFEKTPERVVVLSSELLTLVHALGGNIVGTVVPASQETPEGLSPEVMLLGSASSVSVETIMSLEPNLVVGSPRF